MNNFSSWDEIPNPFPQWETNHKKWLSSELSNFTYEEPLAARKALLTRPHGQPTTVRFILPHEHKGLDIYKKWNAWKGFTGPQLLDTYKQGNITNVLAEYIPGKEVHLINDETLLAERDYWTRQLYTQIRYLHSLEAYISDGLSGGVIIDEKDNARIIDLGDLAPLSAQNHLQEIAQNYRSIDSLFENTLGEFTKP
mgnify:CR=1 FL=1